MTEHPRDAARRRQEIDDALGLHKLAAAMRTFAPAHWPGHYADEVLMDWARQAVADFRAAYNCHAREDRSE